MNHTRASDQIDLFDIILIFLAYRRLVVLIMFSCIASGLMLVKSTDRRYETISEVYSSPFISSTFNEELITQVRIKFNNAEIFREYIAEKPNSLLNEAEVIPYVMIDDMPFEIEHDNLKVVFNDSTMTIRSNDVPFINAVRGYFLFAAQRAVEDFKDVLWKRIELFEDSNLNWTEGSTSHKLMEDYADFLKIKSYKSIEQFKVSLGPQSLPQLKSMSILATLILSTLAGLVFAISAVSLLLVIKKLNSLDHNQET